MPNLTRFNSSDDFERMRRGVNHCNQRLRFVQNPQLGISDLVGRDSPSQCLEMFNFCFPGVTKVLPLPDDSLAPDLSHVSLPLLLRDDQIWRMGDHGLALIKSESGFK